MDSVFQLLIPLHSYIGLWGDEPSVITCDDFLPVWVPMFKPVQAQVRQESTSNSRSLAGKKRI